MLAFADISTWVPLATCVPAIPAHTDMDSLSYNYWNIFQFVKKYGNILSLDFANIPSVVVTGLPVIKEVFTQLEPNFLNRPVTLLRKHLFKKNGKFLEQYMVCVVILWLVKAACLQPANTHVSIIRKIGLCLYWSPECFRLQNIDFFKTLLAS